MHVEKCNTLHHFSSAGMPSVLGGCLIFSPCAAASQSSLRHRTPVFPLCNSSCSRLASSFSVETCALFRPEFQHIGALRKEFPIRVHPFALLAQGERLLYVNLYQIFLNLILHHKCGHCTGMLHCDSTP